VRFTREVEKGYLQDETAERVISLMKMMARQTAIDSWRKGKHARQCVGGDSVLAGLAVRSETPSRILLRRESIDEACSAMTPTQRAMVKMKGDGWESREIGERLNLGPSGTADVQFHRLRRAMQKKFGHDE
jgi:DNA-directed RNA polymerase specialized sigma24 family protein